MLTNSIMLTSNGTGIAFSFYWSTTPDLICPCSHVDVDKGTDLIALDLRMYIFVFSLFDQIPKWLMAFLIARDKMGRIRKGMKASIDV